MNILSRADFALLDRVYTPIAYWAHDEFDVRAYQLARANIVGLIIAAVLRQGYVTIHIMDALVVGWFIWLDSRRKPLAIGMANPLRYRQYVRIIITLVGLFFSIMDGLFLHEIATPIWWFSLINYAYFLSVDERPRKPKEAPQKLAMANE